jgi:hypothetical protein
MVIDMIGQNSIELLCFKSAHGRLVDLVIFDLLYLGLASGLRFCYLRCEYRNSVLIMSMHLD